MDLSHPTVRSFAAAISARADLSPEDKERAIARFASGCGKGAAKAVAKFTVAIRARQDLSKEDQDQAIARYAKAMGVGSAK